MILFNSKEKDRNYHRSKKKFFQHELPHSKEKPIHFQQVMTHNQQNNYIPRSKSPQKQQKNKRSLSKDSQKSKKSGFSDKDKLMTKQMVINSAQYTGNTTKQSQYRKQFKSPPLSGRQNNKMKERKSAESKLIKRRSIQHQKDQQIKRKPKFTRLFQKLAASNSHLPPRTPPKSPRYDFKQQNAQIDLSSKQKQELQGLRQQNKFYKIVYKASLQKMKRLQNNIQKQKQDFLQTKKKFQRQLRQLKRKAFKEDKKISIGHLYTYDKKNTLKLRPQNIIAQSQNETSTITTVNNQNKNLKVIDDKSKNQNNKSKKKQQLPSRLSIQST